MVNIYQKNIKLSYVPSKRLPFRLAQGNNIIHLSKDQAELLFGRRVIRVIKEEGLVLL